MSLDSVIPGFYRATLARSKRRAKRSSKSQKLASASPRLNKALFAKQLKAHPTLAESMLKQPLSRLGFVFQPVICGYIPDFAHSTAKLLIEADGSIHNQQKAYDARRDSHLAAKRYTILRFSNNDIRYQLPKVLTQIKAKLATLCSPR